MSLCRDFMFYPSLAAKECTERKSTRTLIHIYGIWIIASLLYLAFKPYNFPDLNAPIPQTSHNLLLWPIVLIWEPLLLAINIALTAVVVYWMQRGSLFLKALCLMFWCSLSLMLIICYVKDIINRFEFAIGLIVWFAPFFVFAKSLSKQDWLQWTNFSLGLSSVMLITLIPLIVSVLIQSEIVYKGALAINVLWLIVVGGAIIRTLYNMSMARAILSFLISNLVLDIVVAAVYLLGLMPKEVLKILIYL